MYVKTNYNSQHKMYAYLYENELFNSLRPDVLTEALKRGKGYKQATKSRIRSETISPENEKYLLEEINLNAGDQRKEVT